MKYIIEIEDEPLVRGGDTVWRAKGFKSLVFDQNGLDKLKSLDRSKSAFKVGDEVQDDSGRLAYVLAPNEDNVTLVLTEHPFNAFASQWKKTGMFSSAIRNVVLRAKLSMDMQEDEECH